MRHENFSSSVAKLAKKIPRIHDIIEGAIWSISRNPDGEGVKNPVVGVWQATVITGSDENSPRVLIFYVFNRRLVKFLTVTPDTAALN
ncbi:MAG: hypothetical protein ACREHD_04820 [Pirellulales bacterium]